MSYNGSGTFTIINTFVPNTTILSAAVNQNFTDIATGLSTAVCKDGQQTLTANIPMANFKFTGMGSGSARTDSINFGQVQDGKASWVVAAGTVDAITATYSPAITALTDGQLFFFRASGANTSTTPTFNPNGLGALTITKKGGSALIAGDIPGNLAEVILRYNNANTRYELLNPVLAGANPPPASFKNLVIKVATNTTVSYAADFITVTDGTNFQTLAFSGTINLGTNGAANALDTGTIAIDTFYYIWAIAKPDGTAAGLASTSASSPTMPSGYTYKARVGAVQTIHGSATLYGSWQFGRKAHYVVGLAQTSVLPVITNNNAAATWTSVATTRFVPSTASQIFIQAGLVSPSSVGSTLQIAPSSVYSTTGNANPITLQVPLSTAFAVTAEMMLETTAIWYGSSGSASINVACYGWEDNL